MYIKEISAQKKYTHTMGNIDKNLYIWGNIYIKEHVPAREIKRCTVIHLVVTHEKQNYKYASEENWHQFCLFMVKKMLSTNQGRIYSSIKHNNKAPGLV